MVETAGRDTRASDLNLVYGLGKIMDPTSVVREGEMVMVKATGSLPDWLIGTINSVNGGAALTPETRDAIMNEAYSRMQSYDAAFAQDIEQYKGIVDRMGANPLDVIPSRSTPKPYERAVAPPVSSTGTSLPPATASPPPPPAVGDVVDGHRFKGGDPADPNSWELI